jgi:hypothetical protein
LGPGEASLPLDPEDLLASGVFGVGMVAVHSMLRRASSTTYRPKNHALPEAYFGH